MALFIFVAIVLHHFFFSPVSSTLALCSSSWVLDGFFVSQECGIVDMLINCTARCFRLVLEVF